MSGDAGTGAWPPNPDESPAAPLPPGPTYPPAAYGTGDPAASGSAYAAGYPPTYPGYGPSAYGPPAPAQRTDGVSVAALACGCLLLFPAALVLGIVGIVRTNRPELKGRGMAIAGVVLGVVGGCVAVLVAAGIVLARSDTGHDLVDLATGDKITVDQLAVGICFQTPPDDEEFVDLVDVVDCSLAHDLEVYLVDTTAFAGSPDGAPFPGQTAVGKAGNAVCLDAFEGFVGLDYDSSDLDFIAISPSEDTWTSLDGRTVFCSVGDPSGPTTGSLAGAGR